MPKTVRVLLFATAREAVGAATIARVVPPSGRSLRDFVDELAREYPLLGPVLGTSRLVRNGEYVRGPEVTVRPGDEIAIHPPYSGG